MSAAKLQSDEWAGETLPLPLGEIEIAFDRRELEWAGWRLGDFLPAAYFEVRGLRNRYRYPGIGAPLVATLDQPVEGADAARRRAHIPQRLKVPVSGFLRIDDARAQIVAGRLEARLELFTQDEALSVEVEGGQVPLEFETSSALAYTLDGPPIWFDEFRQFLYGGVVPRLTAAPADQLLFLRPYRPGRIPDRARARHGLERGALGRAGERARGRPRDLGALPGLAVSLRLGQSDRLLRAESSGRR